MKENVDEVKIFFVSVQQTITLSMCNTILEQLNFNSIDVTQFRQGNNTDEEAAKAFLERYDDKYSSVYNTYVHADWNYNTNLTDENAQAAVKIKF